MSSKWAQRLGVWSIAERFPDLPAIVHSPSTGTATFGQLVARAHQLVHAVRSAGIGDGDTVAIALPNDIDIVVWQLAGSQAGWRYYTIGPSLPADELTEIFQRIPVPKPLSLMSVTPSIQRSPVGRLFASA